MPAKENRRRGGGLQSRSSVKRYKSSIAREVEWDTGGGNWTVTKFGMAEVVVKNIDYTADAVTQEAIWKNSLDMCRIRRYAHISSKDARDVMLGRVLSNSVLVHACLK
jgi:hypothetical protein